uniref:Uncharacterized protein n=1 Tax=Ananas comosus var. bracteatus TaxID=296719 RepID=A0A6V7NY55_ANACO|nr:unnamed protein product [Ananas comosus var. bracteatus]
MPAAAGEGEGGGDHGGDGTGKTKLSIEVAGRLGGEVVNTDKIQVYGGLDITTNRCRRPTASASRTTSSASSTPPPASSPPPPSAPSAPPPSPRSPPAAACPSSPAAPTPSSTPSSPATSPRRPRPLPTGPSGGGGGGGPIRYDCCFLWVDVEEGVLAEHLDRRWTRWRRREWWGAEGLLRKEEEEEEQQQQQQQQQGRPGRLLRIGEGDRGSGVRGVLRGAEDAGGGGGGDKDEHAEAGGGAGGKIRRMQGEWGWPLRRLDATEAVLARLAGDGRREADAVAAAWERDVLGPGLKAVQEFLSRNANADAEEDTEDETAAPDAEAEEVQAVVQQLLSSVC